MVRTIADPKEIEQLIVSLLHADDMAILCDDSKDLENIVTRLDEVLMRWGLEISPEKTEVLTIDRYGRAGKPNIILRGKKVKNVDKFKYLGSIFTTEPRARTPRKKAVRKIWQKKAPLATNRGCKEDEKQGKYPKKTSFLTANIENRLSKADGAFYQYAAPLYRRSDVHMKYKLKIFKMTAIPTLLYGSEVWAPSKDEVQRLESWQHKCIR